MAKKTPFNPFAGRKDRNAYDMETAKASGQKPVMNSDDKKLHWGSLDPRTGMVLKSRGHPTWFMHEATGAAMGAKQVFKKGRYYSEGSGPVDLKKAGVKSRAFDKNITPNKTSRG